MADRSRSRSRSPRPPADQPPADAPPASDGAPPADDGAPAPAAAPEGGGDEVKLYVGNLDYATDETRLRDEFSQFGTVTEVFLPTERGTSRPRGFGFVTLATREAAEKAIYKMDVKSVSMSLDPRVNVAQEWDLEETDHSTLPV